MARGLLPWVWLRKPIYIQVRPRENRVSYAFSGLSCMGCYFLAIAFAPRLLSIYNYSNGMESSPFAGMVMVSLDFELLEGV